MGVIELRCSWLGTLQDLLVADQLPELFKFGHLFESFSRASERCCSYLENPMCRTNAPIS
jgi:hypothetical protein